MKGYSRKELRRFHESRSPKAIAVDEDKQHSTVINLGDLKRWKHNPGTADVEGIDTVRPRRVKRNKGRITPKMPKLR